LLFFLTRSSAVLPNFPFAHCLSRKNHHLFEKIESIELLVVLQHFLHVEMWSITTLPVTNMEAAETGAAHDRASSLSSSDTAD
jgi:hypothetical protein